MDSFEDLWNLICADVRQKISETAYNVWFKPLKFIKYENDKITLQIEAEFMRTVILDKFSTAIRDSVENVLGFTADVEIILPGDDPSDTKVPDSAAKSIQKKYEYSFENFVTGPTNKFAHAAALNVANAPGKNYNPLFIYGHSGLGKTHLLSAIQNKIYETNPDLSIIYTSGELFTNEMIHFLTIKNMQAFHEKYRKIDVLLIDDIQFIAKTTTAQEEFFHTFDSLVKNGNQVVLTSDRPPKEMLTLDERLRSRFENGLICDIQPPSLETRMAIIKKKAEEKGIELSDEIVKFIADNIKKNIRQLEGIVKRIEALYSLNGQMPSLLNVKGLMSDIINDEPSNAVTVDNIIKEVARMFNVQSSDILSDKRNADIVKARQVTIHLIHRCTNLSLQAIGKEIGGKHYTTIIHSLKEIETKMEKNVTLKATVDDILKNIEEMK